jgi:hypothetical protein
MTGLFILSLNRHNRALSAAGLRVYLVRMKHRIARWLEKLLGVFRPPTRRRERRRRIRARLPILWDH